jgi:hypothetical protein
MEMNAGVGALSHTGLPAGGSAAAGQTAGGDDEDAVVVSRTLHGRP